MLLQQDLEVAELRESVANLRLECDQLQAQNKLLEGLRVEASAEIKRLSQQCERYKAKVKKLTAERY